VSFLNLTGDSTCRADSGAEGTTLTLVGVNNIAEKLLADTCGTLLINDVSDIFIAEESESGENRVRSSLTERAERCRLDVVCKFFELVEVFHFAVTVSDLVEDFKKSYSTDTAGRALTAGFVNGEFEEELSDVNHTCIFVHDDETAGTHHGTSLNEGVEVDRSIDEFCRETSAGRTTGLSCLELLAVGNAAADFFNNFTESSTHGDFHETGVLDLTAESEYLGTGRTSSTEGLEPISTVENDLSDVSVGFYVVYDGRLTPETLNSRERRTGTGFTAVTFNGGKECGFFAAYECACTETDVEVEIEAGTENVLTEKTVFTSLVDSDLESLNCDRIFCTNVYPTFVSADRVSCDSHSFYYCMGVTFENGTVHECARVTFVGVTYNVLLVGNGSLCELPLTTSGESAAAATAKTGIENGLNNVVGSHFLQNLSECEVTVHSDVFIDLFGVDYTAVTESNSLLLLVEGSIAERSLYILFFLFIAGIVVNKTFNNTTLEEVFGNDFRDIIGSYHAVEGAFGIYDHDRTESTKTEAAGHNDLYFFFKTLHFKLFSELVCERTAAGRSTTGTAANQYMRTNHKCFSS